MKSKNWLLFLLVIIMLSGIFTSMLNSIRIIDKIAAQNSQQRTQILSAKVHDSIMNEMIRPITVAETMAIDDRLIRLMERAGNSSTNVTDSRISEYLRSIHDGFGYKEVFVVCDATKTYYTCEGYSRRVEPDVNRNDIWYKIFCESKKYYDLDVDTDKVNNWDLSVFINIRVNDTKGKFLGICGVGVEMNTLQSLIKDCEKNYGIKINLINQEGLVQVASDKERIENDYLDVSGLETSEPDEYSIKRVKDMNVVTSYMDELDWFLIIEDKGFQKVKLLTIVWPSIIILHVGLLAMAGTFYIMHYRKKSVEGELSEKVEIEKRQMDILTAMSRIYLSSHVINLKEDTVEEISTAEHIRFMVNEQMNAVKQMEIAMRYTVEKEYLEAALLFTDLTTLKERMKDSKMIVDQFVGVFNGWFRAQFIVNSYDEKGEIETVIFTTQIIDDEKKQQERLVRISMTDELTGLYNRRAYEKRMEEIEKEFPEDLVLISMDLNGLKNANDTKGHEAGDELICGAAKCMMETFLDKGQVFRIGGDEFIAIIQSDDEEVQNIINKFQQEIHEWNGVLNQEMSISCGVVSHCGFPELGISELAAMADKFMYDDKHEYYKYHSKKEEGI